MVVEETQPLVPLRPLAMTQGKLTKLSLSNYDLLCSGGVASMMSGDYMVHIFVQKLKEIAIPENEKIDAMF